MTASKHCRHFLHTRTCLSLVAPPNPRVQTSQDLLKSKPLFDHIFNIAVSTAAFTILKLWTIGYQDVATPCYWALVELQESRHLAGPPETSWMNRPSILMFMTHGCLWIKAISSPCSVSLFLSCVCVLDTRTCVRAHLCVYTCEDLKSISGLPLILQSRVSHSNLKLTKYGSSRWLGWPEASLSVFWGWSYG